jgi:hypothetical protein
MADRKTTAPTHPTDMDESLWNSPAKPAQNIREDNYSNDKSSGVSKASYEGTEGNEAALRRELASVRKVNEAIEGVVQNLERAKTNMKVQAEARAIFVVILTIYRL